MDICIAKLTSLHDQIGISAVLDLNREDGAKIYKSAILVIRNAETYSKADNNLIRGMCYNT